MSIAHALNNGEEEQLPCGHAAGDPCFATRVPRIPSSNGGTLARLGWILAATLVGCFPLVGCQRSPAAARPSTNTVSDPNSAHVSVLFIGNSHSASIPDVLTRMFDTHVPGVRVCFRMGPRLDFLEGQAKSESVWDAIRRHNWDYVVLQAQKYSTSGKYTYPTDGAVRLAKFAKENGSKAILYPEFPRRGVDEYERIRAIHESIADKTSATIAPIGEAWALARKNVNASQLYAADGNHASEKGNYLVAAVFFGLFHPPAALDPTATPKHPRLWSAAQKALELDRGPAAAPPSK